MNSSALRTLERAEWRGGRRAEDAEINHCDLHHYHLATLAAANCRDGRTHRLMNLDVVEPSESLDSVLPLPVPNVASRDALDVAVTPRLSSHLSAPTTMPETRRVPAIRIISPTA